ncbi:MAG TPA: hypothetical protein VHI13_06925, partial [Candidatus Kapabacteria bacterium]|nr:hypothetical protein [Candidatus Kapabacteria bacterium]
AVAQATVNSVAGMLETEKRILFPIASAPSDFAAINSFLKLSPFEQGKVAGYGLTKTIQTAVVQYIASGVVDLADLSIAMDAYCAWLIIGCDAISAKARFGLIGDGDPNPHRPVRGHSALTNKGNCP